MTDDQFMHWLKGYSAATQGCEFGPIVAVFTNDDGSINRERMLEAFGDMDAACRQKLLTGGELR